MTKRSSAPLPLATMLGLAASVVAVLFIALFSYRSLVGRAESAARVTIGLQTLEQLEGVLSTLKDAETGQRGFLLTGSESYLAPFNEAKAGLGPELARLEGLLVDPDQRQRLAQVRGFAGEKMAELQGTVDLRRRGLGDAAMAEVRTDRGRVTMDRLRALVAQIEGVERERLASHEREWQAAVAYSSFVAWGGSVLLLFCIVAAGVIMSRDHRARSRQAWLQLGQVGLGAQMQGEQRLDQLGSNVLDTIFISCVVTMSNSTRPW